eukprot:6194224-Pleurochrysis_carterae.AAC.1
MSSAARRGSAAPRARTLRRSSLQVRSISTKLKTACRMAGLCRMQERMNVDGTRLARNMLHQYNNI